MGNATGVQFQTDLNPPTLKAFRAPSATRNSSIEIEYEVGCIVVGVGVSWVRLLGRLGSHAGGSVLPPPLCKCCWWEAL